MDKLKTRVLFISLVILALVSISAVAAADSVDDNVTSEKQNDFDLSDEAVSDVEDTSPDAKGEAVLSSGFENTLKEDGKSKVTVYFHMMSGNGEVVSSESNTLSPGVGWSFTLKKFDNKIANYKDFKYQGKHYVFQYWINQATGEKVTETQKFSYSEDGDYDAHYEAVYDISPIGSLTVNYIDNIAHGGGSMGYAEYGTSYTHTFKTPADIPDGAVFLYWEHENGTQYGPGDKLQVKSSEIKPGVDLTMNVYAVYDIKTSIKLEEITGYVGDTADITAVITENINNKPVPGGTATLTIDYENKLSNGLLGASAYTDTVEVDADGNAVFKDVKLEKTGTYKYTVTYSGYNYNNHEEGINDYLSSEADSKLNILPLNTTTTSEDVSGTVGDKKDITAEIIDQNGEPVQNGTAVLNVNGKEYTAEVKDGKAVFEGVELTENTTATIKYLGNDYYNPSNTTINITVAVPEEPEEPKEPEESEDVPDEPKESEEPDESEDSEDEHSVPAKEKAVPVIHTAGNPIALVVLALFALVSTVSFRRKK